MKKLIITLLFIFSVFITRSQNNVIEKPAVLVFTDMISIIEINGVPNYRRKSDHYIFNEKYLISETDLDRETDIVNSFYNTGIEYEGSFTNGYKNGFWKTLYQNKLVKTENYRNGLMIGRYRVYNSEGEILYKTTFGSVGNGMYKDYYYATGTLKEEGRCENGKKEGEWQQYDENGNLTATIIYKEGTPQEEE